jgi:hypothetical protein
LVSKERAGTISRFDIPESYLKKTLHAELPLSDGMLTVMRKLYLGDRFKPTDKLDMRDTNNEFQTFDNWVKLYKTVGVDYAWRDDDDGRVVKSNGENPPLDLLWHGTHYGNHWFHAYVKKFQAAMQQEGYVGLEYYGGNRVGGHLRGGGGVKHRAFVFWDGAAINRFKIGADPSNTGDAEVPFETVRRARIPRIFHSADD